MTPTRCVARIVSLYERAPLRQLLDVDPIGALDWIVVAGARRLVRVLDGRIAVAHLDGAEISSGWRGNLVFVTFWSMVAGGAIIAIG